jgi:hypothetical protein
MALVLALAVPSARSSAQSTDPLLGTWILNVAKSTYEGVPAPQGETRTFDAHGNGQIMYTRRSVNAQGNRSFGHFLVSVDGKDCPEYSRGTAKPTALVAFKKIDDYSYAVTAKHDGKLDVTGTLVVSKDGTTLTWSLKGPLNRAGQQTNRVMVHDRE